MCHLYTRYICCVALYRRGLIFRGGTKVATARGRGVGGNGHYAPTPAVPTISMMMHLHIRSAIIIVGIWIASSIVGHNNISSYEGRKTKICGFFFFCMRDFWCGIRFLISPHLTCSQPRGELPRKFRRDNIILL